MDRIDGITPGVYGVGLNGRVEPVRERLSAKDHGGMSTNPFGVDTRNANLVVSVVGDPESALQWLGDRGYRILNVEAGIVAQRVCIIAAAAGLLARPYNTYNARGTIRILGLEASKVVPVFQFALGRPGRGDLWRVRLAV